MQNHSMSSRQSTKTVTKPKKAPPRKAAKGVAQKREIGPKDPITGERGLTPGEEQFCALVAQGESQTGAYLVAFPHSAKWKRDTVCVKASVLAATDKVSERVRELAEAARKANEIGTAEVFAELKAVAFADHRKLVSYRRFACRFCHGIDHRYQFTPNEMRVARARHEAERIKNPGLGEFSEEGGVGYSQKAMPHPDCPECHGDGEGKVIINDTHALPDDAAVLYAGVEIGKDGIKVKAHDKLAALDKLARHLDFFNADNKTEVTVSPNHAELDAFFEEAMAKTREAEKHAKARKQRLDGEGG